MVPLLLKESRNPAQTLLIVSVDFVAVAPWHR